MGSDPAGQGLPHGPTAIPPRLGGMENWGICRGSAPPVPLCLSVTTRRTQEPIARGAAFGAEVVPKEWTGAGAKSHKATNGYDELPSAMRPRPPENGDGDGPRTRGRARCHLCELAYCERTSAEPPETTDLIRFCPPLHPFVSERASYYEALSDTKGGKTGQICRFPRRRLWRAQRASGYRPETWGTRAISARRATHPQLPL